MLGPNNYGGDVVIRTKHAYVVKILEYIGLYVYRRFSVLWSSVIAIHSRGGGLTMGKALRTFSHAESLSLLVVSFFVIGLCD